MNTYLLEIGLEEMPAHMILPAVEQLKSLAKKTCEEYQLSFNDIRTFSTPRRLAVQLHGLPQKQADRKIELKGPPATIAKDSKNNWSKAAKGFALKNGVSVDNLEIREFDGKDYLFVEYKELGKTVPELLQAEVEQWISKLNFTKNMRWGYYKMRFIRPIRWIVSLWNEEVLPVKIEMVEGWNETKGHRFLSSGKSVIKKAKEYEKQMKSLKVIVDFEKRRESILSQILKMEKKYDFKVELEDKLLTEVTNLVEWPTILLGDFEKEFLELPSEVLVTSMAVHQRYFPVFHKKGDKKSGRGDLMPHFVTVRNGDDKGIEIVKRGNEKVLRARLSDARFFYYDDQKKELSDFQTKAKNVVFFHERGSQAQRVKRIAELSVYIAQTLDLSKTQLKHVQRIAEVSKFDLGTRMIAEFPELQGVMGENYAQLKNENTLVCNGIREHYFPRNSKDSLPQNLETVSVAIADKMDLLNTAFSLDMIPTGAADPFGLRRTAQGIIQLILGTEISLDLYDLTSESIRLLDEQQKLTLDRSKLQQKELEFLFQRQRWYMQQRHIRYDLIEAVLKSRPLESLEYKASPIEQLKLAEFLEKHLETDIFKRSVEAIVRASNISYKYPNKIAKTVKISALMLKQEKDFFTSLGDILNSDQQSLWNPENYLKKLHSIEPVVTSFFEDVMVMDKDPVKCGNRLWLCSQLAKWSRQYLDLRDIVFT